MHEQFSSATSLSSLNQDDSYTVCYGSVYCKLIVLLYFRWLLHVVAEVILACKIQVEICATLICITNIGKVELQDDLCSVHTLQSTAYSS